jgi:Fe-S-cluster containining protein
MCGACCACIGYGHTLPPQQRPQVSDKAGPVLSRQQRSAEPAAHVWDEAQQRPQVSDKAEPPLSSAAEMMRCMCRIRPQVRRRVRVVLSVLFMCG